MHTIKEVIGGHISWSPGVNETAVCVDAIVKDNIFYPMKYYILVGDYLDKYRDCGTIDDCMVIYEKLIDEGAEVSSWSD